MTRLTISMLAAAATLALGLTGCSRYQIEGDGQGRIVRLDRLTGQVDYLQGTRFVRVENPGDRRRERESLAAVKDWGTTQYDGKYSLQLKTAWRNGRMYYQIGITPVPPANVFNFRIALNDADGFQVSSISLNTPDGTVAAGDSLTQSRIHYSGFTMADEEIYRAIRSWSPRVEFYSGRVESPELPLP